MLATVRGALEKNGEHHWNWYQVVVRDNDPPTDAAGNPLTPPYVDPPTGGYPGQLADGHPWYWDEWAVPPVGHFGQVVVILGPLPPIPEPGAAMLALWGGIGLLVIAVRPRRHLRRL